MVNAEKEKTGSNEVRWLWLDIFKLVCVLPLTLCLSTTANSQQVDANIQTAISSQDTDGITRKDMTPEFLTNLVNYTRQQLEIKTQAYLEANGIRNKKVIVKAEGVYVEAGGQKLAVIRVSDQFDMSRTVIINGILGKEFKRVLCTRPTKVSIPISYGPCAEKIQEAFGVTLVK
jgi:hypothetical protein